MSLCFASRRKRASEGKWSELRESRKEDHDVGVGLDEKAATKIYNLDHMLI